MSGWTDVLSDIGHRHPFLTRLHVCGAENYSSPLPSVIQTSIDIADGLLAEEEEFKRLAMIFPRLLDCPEWIAVGCSLAAIKKEFQPTIENLEPFSPGQKLLLDGKYVVEYVRRKNVNGRPFLVVRMNAKSKAGQKPTNTTKWFPIDQLLRFQPTETKRPLTPIENTGSQSDHVLDRLLDISSFGNRSIFTNKVVLVSRLTRVRQFAEKTHVVKPSFPGQSVSLRDLFQWGGITIEGELDQWGSKQVDAEPVLAVASDLITLREYLANHQLPDVLIVLDSSLPFANDLQALDEILDEGYAVFAVMENRHLDDHKYLEERLFKTWAWSGNDLKQFELAEGDDRSNCQMPFRDFHRSVQNFSALQIEERLCHLPGIDDAVENLQTFKRVRSSDDPELGIIEGKLYWCLLNLARLIRPFGIEEGANRDQELRELLKQTQRAIEDNSIRLGEEAVTVAQDFVKKIKSIMENHNSIPNKINHLEEVLQDTASKNKNYVVLGEASEVPVTENYWKTILSNRYNIRFVTSSELDLRRDCDRLIVCGWLGANRMRDLFGSCIAPSITILVYPFEKEWLRSALSRRRKQKIDELTTHERAKILRTESENIPAAQESEKDQLSIADQRFDFDIVEFELRLLTYRRFLHAKPPTSGEASIEARFVAFSHGTYAYLRPNHKVPVVTDLITGHADISATVPSRDVSQLKIGDYVIFREGSDSDLLRDLADRALIKAGKGELRKKASLWKEALRDFFFEPLYFEQAVKKLRDGGLKRTEVTIRGWLNDEQRIGPQNEKDIDIIARVSGNRELQDQLEYVHRAIKEVRGAHQQAARFLAHKLIAQLPSLLKQGLDSSFHTIEIEDIGQAFVVCVEDIDEKDIEVPITKANRLVKEEL